MSIGVGEKVGRQSNHNRETGASGRNFVHLFVGITHHREQKPTILDLSVLFLDASLARPVKNFPRNHQVIS